MWNPTKVLLLQLYGEVRIDARQRGPCWPLGAAEGVSAGVRQTRHLAARRVRLVAIFSGGFHTCQTARFSPLI